MSAKAIQNWLTNHDGVIPAYDQFHDQVTKLIEQGIASLGEITENIMLDPGLATAILHQVNSKLKKSRRPGVDTLHTAVGHLGKPAVANLVSQHEKLNDIDSPSTCSDHFRQLLNQNYHALKQLDLFARMQGISTVKDMRMAVLLHNLGEIYVSLQDPDIYHQYKNLASTSKDSVKAAIEVFGFNFTQLSRTLAFNWALPELLIESLDESKNAGRKARLVQLAAEIARQAESGWYHKSMYTTQRQCADFLDCNVQEITSSIHGTAIEASQTSPFSDVISPAERLILLPDLILQKSSKQQAKPSAITKVSKSTPLPEQIKALLKDPATNQSTVLGLLLSGLQKDAGFSCVALMLLSGDKNRLETKAGKGLNSNPAFSRLKLDIKHSGLIKSLLQKPQALFINNGNYKKYQSLLPGQLKAASMCDSFVMMSIFIGNNPIGLVYCDRQKIERPVDAASYNIFKSSVMMTSKALTFLAKRNAKSAA